MKKMIAAAAMALGMAVSGIVTASAEPLIVGLAPEPYPPFDSPDASGNWVGWEIDFIRRALRRSEVRMHDEHGRLGRHYPGADQQKDRHHHQLDVDHRRAQEDDRLLRQVLQHARPGSSDRRTSKFDATPEGLKGKIIGVQVSTVHAAYAKKHFTEAAEIKEYQTQDEANQDLAAGRVDAVQADAIALDAFLKIGPGQSLLRQEGQRGGRP